MDVGVSEGENYLSSWKGKKLPPREAAVWEELAVFPLLLLTGLS